MSIGISILSEPDRGIDGYFQNLAEEFENINFALKKDGCDLSPYLYCPESWQDEEEMREFGATEEQIAHNKLITSDEFYPIEEVLKQVERALELAKGYDENLFEYGKEAFVSDLEEVVESLVPFAGETISVQFLRG